MNEIALANFFRVLNDADRFPTEKELAEAAIAAKDELNALRPVPRLDTQAEAAAREICLVHSTNPAVYESLVRKYTAIILKHIQHQPACPEGFVMVPTELTKAMHEAAETDGIGHNVLNWVWKQLLAAAPVAEGEK